MGQKSDIVLGSPKRHACFKEATNLKDNELSLFNLAHIYFYKDETKENMYTSIELVVKSLNQLTNFSKISSYN